MMWIGATVIQVFLLLLNILHDFSSRSYNRNYHGSCKQLQPLLSLDSHIWACSSLILSFPSTECFNALMAWSNLKSKVINTRTSEAVSSCRSSRHWVLRYHFGRVLLEEQPQAKQLNLMPALVQSNKTNKTCLYLAVSLYHSKNVW